MNVLIRWAGALAVAGGGIALAGASALDHVAAGWWILWAACVVITVVAYIVRHQSETRG
ncbi:hypothetical protein [Streptomyces sp. NPDC051162]|uniref:hypothetical protein n=1 Tax=Streptomyces sp. NPDC051162 TaxID=3154747 RepID=UPI00342B7DDA